MRGGALGGEGFSGGTAAIDDRFERAGRSCRPKIQVRYREVRPKGSLREEVSPAEVRGHTGEGSGFIRRIAGKPKPPSEECPRKVRGSCGGRAKQPEVGFKDFAAILARNPPDWRSVRPKGAGGSEEFPAKGRPVASQRASASRNFRLKPALTRVFRPGFVQVVDIQFCKIFSFFPSYLIQEATWFP